MIDDLIGKDEKLRAKFYEALRRPNGGDRKSQEAKEKISFDIIKTDKESKPPTGTSKAYALQKLSDEGQIELLEQVQSGNISANEAMKRAGYRRPRIAIALDDPESAADNHPPHAARHTSALAARVGL